MRLEASRLIAAPLDEVWDSLDDPELLARCGPGCKSLERLSEDEFLADLELGVAAVKGRYRALVKLSDKRREEDRCRLHVAISGEGTSGFVNGDGEVFLERQSDGTLVSYRIEAGIGGRLAQVGQRLLSGVGKLLAGQFLAKLEAELGSRRAPSEPQATT